MDNKRKNIIVLISCIAAVLFSVGVAFFGAKLINLGFSEDYTGVVVDGNYVDNEINNSIVYNNFTRIGDKLYYYHYMKGLYEISEDSAKYIYGSFFDENFSPIRNIDGELYCLIGNEVKKYDSASGKFVDQDVLKDIYSMCVGDILVDDIYDEEEEINRILISFKGELVKTIEKSYYQSFYISGDYVYYAIDGNKINRFNVKDGTDELVVSIGDYWISTIIVEDGKIIFGAKEDRENNSSIFCVDLGDEGRTLKTLVKTEEYMNFNVCDNKVYVCSYGGTLMKIDLNTFEETKLCKKNVYTCYIVDDKWVYFVTNGVSESLWRVTQDGSVVEKVFG